MPLVHALELNAVAYDGPAGVELTAHWSWAGDLLDEADVRTLAEAWFRALRGLVRHAGTAWPVVSRRPTSRWCY
ncbi:hypothetical protein K7G98_07625 [Saccharothrix sp. MB29]|nr:hypothetical protein [Saccharothrix sp. MB29]